MAPRAVRVVRATPHPMERAIVATGTLAAQEQSTLSAKVAGRLEQLTVDIGSVVRKGDLLALVEPRDYELRVQQARAALAQSRTSLGLPLAGDDDRVELERLSTVKEAKALLVENEKNRKRIQDLSRNGFTSQSELDTVEAAFNVAASRYETALEEARSRSGVLAQRRAEYDIARKQLEDASVRAPFDAIVQARPASVGEYLAIGTPIVMLVKIDPLRLRLNVPERDSARVRSGQQVRLFVEGDERAYEGHIARLSPALDEQSRMLLVEADVPRQGSLRAGMFARAQIIVNEREDGVSVPGTSIMTFAGLEKVIVIQDGKALEKVISTGRHGSNWIEVVSGIRAGEIIVLNPVGLRTGQPLTVASDGGGAASVSSSERSRR